MQIIKLSSEAIEPAMQRIQRPAAGLASYLKVVQPILKAVKDDGDDAIKRFTKKFDGVALDNLRVSKSALQEAFDALDPALLQSLKDAIRNITAFHKKQITNDYEVETQPGISCKRIIRPMKSAGLYIPAGSAPLVSTVLMLAIPAQLAGVERIVVASPPQKNDQIDSTTLSACALLNIEEIYSIGGAQAIGALAYGTESIEKVEKICGPGNAYVTAAKAEVSIGAVGIDMLAGPSELMVIADEAAQPKFVAADLLSQAEHDPLSQVILVTEDELILDSILREIEEQLSSLPRAPIAKESLQKSTAILVQNMEQALQLSNAYAPEHLSIQTRDPEALLPLIENAGSVFLGSFSPEAAGDYCSGTNHVLPTGGSARFQSGVSVGTFQKGITVQKISEEGLCSIRKTITCLARAEGLEAHARAVDIRFPASS